MDRVVLLLVLSISGPSYGNPIGDELNVLTEAYLPSPIENWIHLGRFDNSLQTRGGLTLLPPFHTPLSSLASTHITHDGSAPTLTSPLSPADLAPRTPEATPNAEFRPSAEPIYPEEHSSTGNDGDRPAHWRTSSDGHTDTESLLPKDSSITLDDLLEAYRSFTTPENIDVSVPPQESTEADLTSSSVGYNDDEPLLPKDSSITLDDLLEAYKSFTSPENIVFHASPHDKTKAHSSSSSDHSHYHEVPFHQEASVITQDNPLKANGGFISPVNNVFPVTSQDGPALTMKELVHQVQHRPDPQRLQSRVGFDYYQRLAKASRLDSYHAPSQTLNVELGDSLASPSHHTKASSSHSNGPLTSLATLPPLDPTSQPTVSHSQNNPLELMSFRKIWMSHQRSTLVDREPLGNRGRGSRNSHERNVPQPSQQWEPAETIRNSPDPILAQQSLATHEATQGYSQEKDSLKMLPESSEQSPNAGRARRKKRKDHPKPTVISIDKPQFHREVELYGGTPVPTVIAAHIEESLICYKEQPDVLSPKLLVRHLWKQKARWQATVPRRKYTKVIMVKPKSATHPMFQFVSGYTRTNRPPWLRKWGGNSYADRLMMTEIKYQNGVKACEKLGLSENLKLFFKDLLKALIFAYDQEKPTECKSSPDILLLGLKKASVHFMYQLILIHRLDQNLPKQLDQQAQDQIQKAFELLKQFFLGFPYYGVDSRVPDDSPFFSMINSDDVNFIRYGSSNALFIGQTRLFVNLWRNYCSGPNEIFKGISNSETMGQDMATFVHDLSIADWLDNYKSSLNGNELNFSPLNTI